ncbi:hypothetical protein PF008_g27538 [Phytophthora fragariae]|uniref:Secreted protein n=1 Tax=Phytophthora fragariae TaxID=53985 RepID=A0A6G0QDU8_9STRA|nr:hypothetical protein PF008_g27538 [Phytophthora fragariae]
MICTLIATVLMFCIHLGRSSWQSEAKGATLCALDVSIQKAVQSLARCGCTRNAPCKSPLWCVLDARANKTVPVRVIIPMLALADLPLGVLALDSTCTS